MPAPDKNPSSPLEMEGAKNSIGFMLSKVGGAMADLFAKTVGEFGLTPRQFFVLNLICQHEGKSQNAIGESIGVAKSQMVAVVDELEAKSLLERRVNPDDRRQHALYLTKAGTTLREKAFTAAVAHEQRLRELLTVKEADTLLAALQKLATADGTPLGVHGTMAEKFHDETESKR
jgi:DNA-binding MarR family transcriptional regulator